MDVSSLVHVVSDNGSQDPAVALVGGNAPRVLGLNMRSTTLSQAPGQLSSKGEVTSTRGGSLAMR